VPAQPGWHWLFDERVTSRSLLSQYSTSLYLSFELVVGSANLPAYNNLERVYYLIVLIIGAVLYAYIVSRECPWRVLAARAAGAAGAAGAAADAPTQA
jgi:hypothetical protein